MNRLIIFIYFVLSFSTDALSDCAPYYFRVWPEGKTLSRNPLIVMNFSEPQYLWMKGSKSVASEMGKKMRFSLKSESSEIPLRLIQRNRGKTDENQLLFKPDGLLEPNTSYELIYTSKDSTLTKRLFDQVRFRSQIWTTSTVLDQQAPEWKCSPQLLYKNYAEYGCGPESYWKFCLSFKDKSTVYIQTIVRHLDSGKVSEYLLMPDSNSVFVGYHMCGGAFDMIQGENYSVSFNLIDASGNSTHEFSEPLVVKAPTGSDYLSDEELEKKKCTCDNSAQTKGLTINPGWILGIIGVIVFIALINWVRNHRKGQ